MALAGIRRSALYARNIMTSAARRSGEHSEGGIPGENLPFSISNRYRLTALFTIFLGSGLAAPFLLVRHQLLKK